jgi:glycerol-3-phosphate acyltransferase PlsY
MFLGIISIVIGYLLGSIPSAYIMVKYRKGIDIRNVDTGNVGAGSTIRQLGRRDGLIVAAVDIGKGAGAVLIAQALDVNLYFVLAAGFAAIVGHAYPFSIGFRGGQGVSTILGIFLVLTPFPMLIVLGIMGLALLITRHIFSMTCLSAPFLPLLIWIFGEPVQIILYSLIIIAFVLFRSRHRIKEFRFPSRQ